MKILFLLLICFSAHSAELILRFESEIMKQRWIEWYLDKGGEGSSGFVSNDWNDNLFALTYEYESTCSCCEIKDK